MSVQGYELKNGKCLMMAYLKWIINYYLFFCMNFLMLLIYFWDKWFLTVVEIELFWHIIFPSLRENQYFKRNYMKFFTLLLLCQNSKKNNNNLLLYHLNQTTLHVTFFGQNKVCGTYESCVMSSWGSTIFSPLE